VCHAGTQSCGADQKFGACDGEVVPTPEQCLTTVDEDCDGVVLDPEDGCGCTPGALTACYDGPPSTDGVGSCKAGSAVCNAEGNGFATACVGMVKPIVEECGSPIDDDCDGEINDWCATWALRFPGANTQSPRGVAYQGNFVYVTGDVQGAVNFGTGALTANGTADAFIAKFDMTTGELVWAQLYGGAGTQRVQSIAVDDAGDIYVGGYFDTGFAPGGTIMPLVANAVDSFVMKATGADGTPVWVWHGGGTSDQQVYELAVDAATGEAVVTGNYAGVMNTGVSSLTAATSDGFLVKLDAAGVAVWGIDFGGDQVDNGEGLEVDGAGNIYLAGNFAETIDFGSGPINDLGGNDAFVAKLTPSGTYTWSYPIRAAMEEVVYNAALGPDGSVHVVGEFTGTVDFGGGGVTSAGDTDVFVLKLSADGEYIWSTTIAGEAEEQGKDIWVGPDGKVLVGVDFWGNVMVGDELVLPGGSGDLGIVVLDSEGTPELVRRFGELSDDNLRRVLMPAPDVVLFSAECLNPVDFGAGHQSAPDTSVDICLVRLDP
jgi:hypothetical protein